MAKPLEQNSGPGDKQILESIFSSPYKIFITFLIVASVLIAVAHLAQNYQVSPTTPNPYAENNLPSGSKSP